MPEESKTKYFQDEHAIKQLIEKKTGTIVKSDKAITDADLQFFKDGEARFDSANQQLVICDGNQLRRISVGQLSPLTHHTTHEPGGSDEVIGITPAAHHVTHENGGSDEVATATPAANAIPKAGAGGTLASGFIPDFSATYAVAAKGVTNGDTHDHAGGDGAQIDHTGLLNKGTNTHAQIDTFVASKAQASGLASLDGSSKVVQDPVNATATPTASKIPIADGDGKLNSWVDTSTSVTHVLIRKTANETVNNSDVLQDDDQLLFAIAANETWLFQIYLGVTAGGNSGLKCAITVPSGATLEMGVYGAENTIGAAVAGNNRTATSGELLYGLYPALVMGSVTIRGSVLNGATAGNVTLQWTQWTAYAENTTVLKGSFLIAHKVS